MYQRYVRDLAQSAPSDLDHLTRFVCIGSEEGCFNVHEKPEFKDKVPSLSSFLSKEKGMTALQRLRRIFEAKSFVSKDPFLYSLARIIRGSPVDDLHHEDRLRREAYALAEEACQTAEELFTFVEFDKKVSSNEKAGWGRGMRKFVKRWYEGKPPRQLVSLVTRCKSAKGWSHRDLLRQCHIKPERKSKGTSLVVNYLISGKKVISNYTDSGDKEVEEVVLFLRAMEQLNASRLEEKEIVRGLIETHQLCDRQIPSKLYKMPEAYEGMLGHMSLEELFHNVHKMAALKMMDAKNHTAKMIIDRIGNKQDVVQEKVPPMVIMAAQRKYLLNRKKEWVLNSQCSKAIEAAREASLTGVDELPHCSMLIAVHMSLEERKKLRVKGAPYLTPVIAAAQIIKYMHHTKATIEHIAFKSGIDNLNIDSKSSVTLIVEALESSRGQPQQPDFDLIEPIKWATQQKAKYECILIITDKKKVASQEDFREALKVYRQEAKSGHCRVAVLGLSDESTCVADRCDLDLLEVSGFKEEVAPLLLRFFRGKLHFDAAGDSEISGAGIGVWGDENTKKENV